MPAIAAAHNIPYVATACPSYPIDLIQKVKKAAAIEGAGLPPHPFGLSYGLEVGARTVDQTGTVGRGNRGLSPLRSGTREI